MQDDCEMSSISGCPKVESSKALGYLFRDILQDSISAEGLRSLPAAFFTAPMSSNFNQNPSLFYFISLEHLLSPCLYGQKGHSNKGR
jgi:hypothetical protein